jgi:hypothetical protein
MAESCPQCQQPVSVDHNFCPNCAAPLSTKARVSTSSTSSVTGDRNFNMTGTGNTLLNSPTYIGDRYEAPPHEPAAVIERAYQKPLSLFGQPAKDGWVLVPTIVGLLANVATIQTSWLSGPWTFLVVPVFALVLGGVGAFSALSKYRFLKIPGSRWSLESANDHSLYLTRISGSCPYCSGRLDLQGVGPLEQRITMVVCQRNPTLHKWLFDPTVLEEIT